MHSITAKIRSKISGDSLEAEISKTPRHGWAGAALWTRHKECGETRKLSAFTESSSIDPDETPRVQLARTPPISEHPLNRCPKTAPVNNTSASINDTSDSEPNVTNHGLSSAISGDGAVTSGNSAIQEAWDRIYKARGEQNSAPFQSLQFQSVDGIFNELRRVDVKRRDESKFCQVLEKLGPIVKKVGSILAYATPIASVDPIASASFGLVQSTVLLIVRIVDGLGELSENIGVMLNHIPAIKDLAEMENTSHFVHDSLISIYEDLLRFKLDADHMLSRDRSLLAGIFRDRISPIVNDFNKHMEILHSNITIHSHILHLQQEQSKKIDKLLEDERRCKENLQSNPLSEVDFRRTLRESRAKDSGSLFFGNLNSPFVTWRDQPEPNIISVYGYPGSGKTMAMATIVDSLEQKFGDKSGPDLPVICSFFCREDGERSKYMTILRSLAAQVIDQERHLLTRLIERVKKRKASIFAAEASILATEGELEKLVSSLIREAECPFFIVIDAIDECDQASRESLLKFLGGLYFDLPTSSRIKCLLSARPRVFDRPGVFDQFSSQPVRIPLENYQQKDMPLIVKHHVDQFFSQRYANGEVQAFLLDFLSQNAGNCALWVKVVLEYLKSTETGLPNIVGLKKLLKDIPSDLEKMYAKMIGRLEPPNARYVLQALGILTVAVRPLTVNELSFTLTLGSSENQPSTMEELREMLDEKRIRSLLSPFTRIEEPHITLFHQSLKDFLLSAQLPESIFKGEISIDGTLPKCQDQFFHGLVARSCVVYLSLEEFEDNNLYGRKGELLDDFICLSDSLWNDSETSPSTAEGENNLPVLEYCPDAYFSYASYHWAHHLACASKDQACRLVKNAVALSKHNSTVLWNWSETYRRAYGRVNESWEFPDFESLDPLLVAATFDHPHTIRKILSSSVARSHDSFKLACVWAARRGSLHSINELFKHEVGGLAQIALGECLYEAVQYNHVNISSFLLDKFPEGEISFSKSDGAFYRNALTMAIERGYKDLVETIFFRTVAKYRDYKILLIALPGKYRANTDLDLVKRQRTKIFEFLVENATVEEDTWSWLLYNAARMGDLFSVEYLLDQERDKIRRLSLKDYSEYGCTALQQAVQFGKADVVEFLCQQPEMQSQLQRTYAEGENLIHIAAKHGHEKIIPILIQRYPDGIGAIDDDGRSTLSIAALSGNPQVVRLLLNTTKVEVDAPCCNNNYTPLMYAVAGGKLEMCKVLIIEGNADYSKVLETAENGKSQLRIPTTEWGYEQTLSALCQYAKTAEEHRNRR
ncbi:uncharacterized protein K441DRAFT_617512 [Cenococcum geophilum 1.58]|uniref:uncharacterized protein n=1 Tax=Cenococcum geophilum 1.58 TaxID=794803 RepID=UPI00358F0780|nr:hypothetical protein K441DRAFT_617512 [Cenococcum geophilum 1.58]